MAPRGWAGTLLGYEAKNQWRIFDGKRTYVRRDVIFNEANLTYKSKEKVEITIRNPPQSYHLIHREFY